MSISRLIEGQDSQQAFKTEGFIDEFAVEGEILAMIIKENGAWFVQVIELKTNNLLRKSKIEERRKFLVWKK